MKLVFQLFIFAVVITLLINCSNTKKTGMQTGIDTTQTSSTLTGTYWKLIELMGNTVQKTPAGQKDVYIKLKKDENKLEGFGGCNGFGGEFSTKNDFNISITNIISTMIACPDLQRENELFNVLKNVDNYYVKGDTLSLSKARMATMAKFVSVNLQ